MRCRAPRWTNWPHIQAASASTTRNKPSQSESASRLEATHISQTAVASMGKPMAFLNFSIQAPGFGSSLSKRGFQQSTTNGQAKPSPAARKTRTVTAAVG